VKIHLKFNSMSKTSFVAFPRLVDQFLCIITGRFYGGLKMCILFSPVETEHISPLENNIVVFPRYKMIDSQRGVWRRTAPSLLQSSHTQQMRVL